MREVRYILRRKDFCRFHCSLTPTSTHPFIHGFTHFFIQSTFMELQLCARCGAKFLEYHSKQGRRILTVMAVQTLREDSCSPNNCKCDEHDKERAQVCGTQFHLVYHLDFLEEVMLD